MTRSKSSKPGKTSASKSSPTPKSATRSKGSTARPRITDERNNDLSALNSIPRGRMHMADDEKRYPQDLGMRWFFQGSHLPDESHQTESDGDDVPAGRLRLTRTAPGGWGKPQ